MAESAGGGKGVKLSALEVKSATESSEVAKRATTSPGTDARGTKHVGGGAKPSGDSVGVRGAGSPSGKGDSLSRTASAPGRSRSNRKLLPPGSPIAPSPKGRGGPRSPSALSGTRDSAARSKSPGRRPAKLKMGQGKSRMYHDKPWVGSPSSFKSFTFSSPVNDRVVNKQDVPVIYPFFTGAEGQMRDKLRSKEHAAVKPAFLDPELKRTASRASMRKLKSKPSTSELDMEAAEAAEAAAEFDGTAEAKRKRKPRVTKAQRRERERRRKEFLAKREKEWQNSPSSYRHLSFSSRANKYIRNLQEIPPVVEYDFPEYFNPKRLPPLRPE